MQGNMRKAKMSDMKQVVDLINSYAKDGIMLKKTPYDFYKNVENFFVYELDDKIVGCVRLSVLYKNEAELASLAVHHDYNGRGIGRDLVKCIIHECEYLGIGNLFALTYRCTFFENCGFEPSKREACPFKLWHECVRCPKFECCDEHAYLYRVKK